MDEWNIVPEDLKNYELNAFKHRVENILKIFESNLKNIEKRMTEIEKK